MFMICVHTNLSLSIPSGSLFITVKTGS